MNITGPRGALTSSPKTEERALGAGWDGRMWGGGSGVTAPLPEQDRPGGGPSVGVLRALGGPRVLRGVAERQKGGARTHCI